MSHNVPELEKIKWHTEIRNLADLKPWEKNPRKASARQMEQIGTSLDRFGLVCPIVINTDGLIIGGHRRREHLLSKGIVEDDVRVPHRLLTEDEAEELSLRLNQNHASWDNDMLRDLFETNLLRQIGFEDEFLAKINEDLPDFLPVNEDEQPNLDEKVKIKCPKCGHAFTP